MTARSTWLRVFGATDDVPDQAALAAGLAGTFSFQADATGWYAAEVAVEGPPVTIERYLSDEDGIRAELNAWAAVLETLGDGPIHVALMERTIQARQLITIHVPSAVDQRGVALARRLAAMTGGFYQVDGEGFFDAEGGLLVADSGGDS